MRFLRTFFLSAVALLLLSAVVLLGTRMIQAGATDVARAPTRVANLSDVTVALDGQHVAVRGQLVDAFLPGGDLQVVTLGDQTGHLMIATPRSTGPIKLRKRGPQYRIDGLVLLDGGRPTLIADGSVAGGEDTWYLERLQSEAESALLLVGAAAAGRFSVCVRHEDQLEAAARYAHRFQRFQYPTLVEPFREQGEHRFRTLLGPFAEEAMARDALATVRWIESEAHVVAH